MDFSIDYKSLNQKINKKTYKLADVANKIEKVAFDVVRFHEPSGIDSLWKIENTPDGEVIVALYNESSDIQKSASLNSNWEVFADNSKTNISFFYKKSPIAKIATENLGIPQDELKMALDYLPKKLETNATLRNNLILECSLQEKIILQEKFPELFNEDK